MQSIPYLRLINSLSGHLTRTESPVMAILETVVLLEGDSNYTTLHLNNGQRILMAQTLGCFEKQLVGYGFLRVHKSFIVNTKHIVLIERNILYLSNGQAIEVARRRRREFKKKL